MIDKIHNIVLSDLLTKVCKIVDAQGISYGTVFLVFNEKFNEKSVRYMGAAFAATQLCFGTFSSQP